MHPKVGIVNFQICICWSDCCSQCTSCFVRKAQHWRGAPIILWAFQAIESALFDKGAMFIWAFHFEYYEVWNTAKRVKTKLWINVLWKVHECRRPLFMRIYTKEEWEGMETTSRFEQVYSCYQLWSALVLICYKII